VNLDLKDSLALVIAVGALLATVWVALYTVQRQQHLARMASFERLHEQLVSGTVGAGRRALFLHARTCSFPAPEHVVRADSCNCLESDLWDRMNEAVAWYDTLATYVRHGQIERAVALRAWYHPLIAIRPSVYRFLDHRARQGISQPWDALQWLLEETIWYSCPCQTCEDGHRPEPQHQPGTYSCFCAMCDGAPRARPARRTKKPDWLSERELMGFASPGRYAGLVTPEPQPK
jgi:hypothetical protein